MATSMLNQKAEDDEFLIILEDQCQGYHIVTSISGLVYRVEVYRNSELEDAVETECNELRMSAESEILFSAQYTKAHDKCVKRFCKKNLKEEGRELEKDNVFDKERIKEIESNKEDEDNALSVFKNKIKHIVSNLKGSQRSTQIIISIISIIFLMFIGRFLICNETVVGFFFDKIDFYKKTEYFCHKLEKECTILSKTNLEQNTVILPKDCRDWCKNKIITKDRCALFLPYFPEEKTHDIIASSIQNEPKPLQKDNVQKAEVKSSYVFTPTGTVVLSPNSDVTLKIANNTLKTVDIELTHIELNENEYEEIVQFRSGLIKLSVEQKEIKQFKVFLEPTYYDQFEKGEYHGKFIFLLRLNDDNKKEIVKDFVFKVK